MSKRILEKSQSKASMLMTALKTAMTDYEKSEMPENAQFGFRAILQTPTVILENSNPTNQTGFDMEFDVPFDDDTIANEAEFVVYNLTDSTANKFKVGNTVSLKAGYGKDIGIIFEGYISKVKTVREGVDKKTTIYALDDVKYTPQMMDEKTYAKGTTASTILKDLLERLNLTIEVFSPQRDFTYDSETKVDGSITENIKQYSEVCGISTYIHKQKIYSRPIFDGDNLNFNVNASTGLIDSPEPFEEDSTSEHFVDKITGYNCKMILQHRLSTAGIVNISSVNYTGKFRVKSGVHSYDGLSATTEFKCIDTISTTIDETKTKTETSSSTNDGTDWKTINQRRQDACRRAVAVAQDERFGYTSKEHSSNSFEFNALNFMKYVWTMAGVRGLNNVIVQGEEISPVFLHCGFERVSSFTMWGDFEVGLWGVTPAEIGLELGDIIFHGDKEIGIYIGNDKYVSATADYVTETQDSWSAHGDNDGNEIAVREWSTLVPGVTVTKYYGVLRYMGTDLPKLS